MPKKRPKKKITTTAPEPEQQELVSPGTRYISRPVSKEMEESYLDYAMSVIVSRALPDVRDGLKPVHRRILYAMHDLGLNSTAKFRKSASVVGEVLAKYHPHGDAAVYDSMVRMAQDFSMRYPLVNGQGNFGSIDGDNAAAYRYTEAKMMKIAEEMLADIDKETIDFRDNFDTTRQEPTVLPSKIPQLLLNGTTGIAVGMATSIPPHNLSELVDALHYLIDNKDCTIDDLTGYLKGPDFPTGGIMYGKNDIKQMYVTGRGGVIVRAKAEIEEMKNGKFAIIVTEIPYQINKSTLIERIADLVRDKKIQGITDLRDESNRDGIRIYIELKKDAYPKKILNQLFKYTNLQSSFNMNMIALSDGIQPRLMNLKEVLEHFVKHRQEVVTRRTQHELRIAKERVHILEGFKTALSNIDQVIKTIKESKTKEDAAVALMKKFKLSDLQSEAILQMRLQALAGLERQKVLDELKEKLALIKELEGILKSPAKILGIIKSELHEMKEKYGDERRTKIVAGGVGDISVKDTVPDEPMIVTLTETNYIKRIPPSTFRTQHRGGKGVMGMMTKEEDEIKLIANSTNHQHLLFFTDTGRVFRLPVYEVPQGTRIAKGQAIVNLLQLRDGEVITAMLSIPEKFTGEYLIMGTEGGTIKKTPAEDFTNVRKSGLIAINLRKGDSLRWVAQISQGNEVMMVTKLGKSIRFPQRQVRPMGRPSQGVRGIRLGNGDKVVNMSVVPTNEAEILVVMENGLGKCTKITNFRMQGRGGSGIKAAKVTPKTGQVIGACVFNREENIGDIILISRKGQLIRLNLKDIPTLGRATQGVYLMRFKKADKVASFSLVMDVKEEGGEGAAEESGAKATKAGNGKRVSKKATRPSASSPSPLLQKALL